MSTSAQSTPQAPQECVYRFLEDTGVHEFVFLKPSALAVHQWAVVWGEVLASSDPAETVYALIDTSPSGMPPMQPMIQRSRQIIARLPARPQTRTSILATFHIFLTIAQELSKPLLRNQTDQVKYFALERREEALDWLLKRGD